MNNVRVHVITIIPGGYHSVSSSLTVRMVGNYKKIQYLQNCLYPAF